MSRIAFVDQVGAAPGGAEQTLATFLEHLPGDLEPIAVLFEDGVFAQRIRDLGIEVVVLDVPSSIADSSRERPKLRAAFETLPVALRLQRLFRERRVDLVYTNSMKAHLIGGLAARLAGARCLMHFHDLMGGVGLPALRAAARLASDGRIACSHLVADSIAARPTKVIYAPIDVDSYRALPARATVSERLGIPDDYPRVALIGRINRWKGHDRYLRIAARVNNTTPVRFIIVGAPVFRDFDFMEELQKLVATYDLTSRVTFVPWMDSVRDVYGAIDVNANCSTREPLGRTIFEAAAAGIPSVCFGDSGASEIVEDGATGRVVPAGNESQFAEAILAYIEDPAARRAAGELARERVAKYAAQPIAREMAQAVREALGSRIADSKP